MTFAATFKKIRKEKKWSQSKTAKKLGVSQKTISVWENNIAQPNFKNTENLYRLFGFENF